MISSGVGDHLQTNLGEADFFLIFLSPAENMRKSISNFDDAGPEASFSCGCQPGTFFPCLVHGRDC